MSQINELQYLKEQQLQQAIAMIGRAFHKDPLSIYVYPDEAERTHRLPLVFSIALHYTLRYGEITTTPEITGVACWLPPDRTDLSIKQLLRIGALATSLKMGLPGLRRINTALRSLIRISGCWGSILYVKGRASEVRCCAQG